MKLNKEQERAVRSINGPMLVVAGAGTGKTRVIVERILNMLEHGIDQGSILALTFTEKAAGEMLDRISQARQSLDTELTIATFNAFGNDLLNQYGAEVGLNNLQLLEKTGQLVFLRQHLDEFELDYFSPISEPDHQLKNLADHASSLKQQMILPEDYLSYAQNLPTTSQEDRLEKKREVELASFFETYLDLCRKNYVIDYDDQLYLVVNLLRKRPNIVSKLQDKYRYILVDEFQDTNPLQSTLLDLLAKNHHNIMVVGDDDQSIYGWRGATLANILDFSKRYPKAKQITLTDNYRSTQAILDCAYRLIQNNNPNRLEAIHKLDKRLIAQRNSQKKPKTMRFSLLESELNWVANDIKNRLSAGQPAGSIAILARKNQVVKRAHEALERYNIEHAVSGLGNNLYDSMVVAQLLEALKAIHDPLDDAALFQTLIGPIFQLEPHHLSELAAHTRREFGQLSSVIKSSDDLAAKQALNQIRKWREQLNNQTVDQIAYSILDDSGWMTRLYENSDHNSQGALEAQALSQIFASFREFGRVASIASVSNYLQNLPMLRAAGGELHDDSLDLSSSLVNVLSVHKSKGLEWQTVFVVDCTEGSFPIRPSNKSLSVPAKLRIQSPADNQLAEERRLMYVAATRAQEELILTYADRHSATSSLRNPSRFLAEFLESAPQHPFVADESSQLVMKLPVSAARSVNLISNARLKTDNIYHMDVSKVSVWLRCPEDFYYRYVLCMPSPTSSRQTYGTVIHESIQAIHESMKSGRQINLDTLLDNAKLKLSKTSYLTKRSKERTQAEALDTIRRLHKRFVNEPIPSYIEEKFRVAIPNIPLVLTGRIDAVYESPDGVEICDYKTSLGVDTAEKAKRKATKSDQLTLYALAWQLLHDQPVALTLDFVQTNIRGSIRKRPKSLLTMQQKLADMVHDLEHNNYPSGKDHSFCLHPSHE